jgi:hypothetical protein
MQIIKDEKNSTLQRNSHKDLLIEKKIFTTVNYISILFVNLAQQIRNHE